MLYDEKIAFIYRFVHSWYICSLQRLWGRCGGVFSEGRSLYWGL